MVTPSMVSEVSATLVETMILRSRVRATARSCASGGSSPCRGNTTQPFSSRRPPSACTVRPISYAPGMNTKKSPSVCPATRAHSRAATSHTGSLSKFTVFGRYSIATGKLRPSEVRISQGARYSASTCASSVADITTIFRSGRVVAWICIARASDMSP